MDGVELIMSEWISRGGPLDALASPHTRQTPLLFVQLNVQ